MKKAFILIVFILAIVSCKKEAPAIPSKPVFNDSIFHTDASRAPYSKIGDALSHLSYKSPATLLELQAQIDSMH